MYVRYTYKPLFSLYTDLQLLFSQINIELKNEKNEVISTSEKSEKRVDSLVRQNVLLQVIIRLYVMYIRTNIFMHVHLYWHICIYSHMYARIYLYICKPVSLYE
jgi:hypothetical protein